MKYLVQLNGVEYEVEVEKGNAQIVTSRPVEIAAAPAAPAEIVQPAAAPAAAPAPAPAAAPAPPPPAVAPAPAPAAAPAPAPSSGGEAVTSPLPGNVFKILVNQGQSVAKGDVLVIIEAMKMENEILAPHDATVAQVVASVGGTVETGDVLMMLQ